jgi:hypothetical protein
MKEVPRKVLDIEKYRSFEQKRKEGTLSYE